MKGFGPRAALRIVLIYVVLAGTWVYLSDRLTYTLTPIPDTRALLHTGQGWLFVLVTALLLYFLLRRELASREVAQKLLERYQILSQRARDIILFVREHDGQILEANQAALTAYGYSREELLGLTVYDLRGGHPPTLVSLQMRTARTEGVLFEAIHRRKDGSEFPVEVSSQGALINGETVLVSVVRDISDRREAAAQLTRSNRALEALRRCNQALVYASDEVSLLQDICRIMVEEGGYRFAWAGFPEQGPDSTVRPVASAGFGAGFLETVKIRWELSESGAGPTSIAVHMREPTVSRNLLTDPAFLPWRPELERRGYASVVVLPLLTGEQLLGVISIYSSQPDAFDDAEVSMLSDLVCDLAFGIAALRTRAEHERAERDLAERARELSLLYETSLEINARHDLSALLDVTTRRASRLFGDSASWLYLLEPDGQTLVMAAGHNFPGPSAGVRLRLGEGLAGRVAQSGEVMVVENYQQWSGRLPAYADLPLARSLGLPLRARDRMIGVLNISDTELPGTYSAEEMRLASLFANQAAIAIDNVRLYEEVRRHASELEDRVLARTAELQQANAALEEAAEKLRQLDRLKSEFVSNVSHELRTPLTNIKMYLELLSVGRPEKRERYLATLERETALLQGLIDGLLQLSRLDLGNVELVLRPVDINKLASSLAGDRSLLAAQKGLTLQIETADALPLVAGDPRLLTQVMSNLITNAMNYTPRGGTIRVCTALEQGEGCPLVSFTVSDTGLGIPPEEQERLFQRFFRGSAAQKSRAPGTGLGLAISDEIARRHGGWITVQSQPGQGSTFTVWIPAADLSK